MELEIILAFVYLDLLARTVKQTWTTVPQILAKTVQPAKIMSILLPVRVHLALVESIVKLMITIVP